MGSAAANGGKPASSTPVRHDCAIADLKLGCQPGVQVREIRDPVLYTLLTFPFGRFRFC